MAAPIEIPKRAFFKSAEVCAIAGVQPYVLKSWEAEFPTLGGKKRKDGSRVYGRPEVELVVQIKELVYGDGLTLGAARRKLRADDTEETVVESTVDEVDVSDDVRQALAGVKQGLREILDLLSDERVRAASQEGLELSAVESGTSPRSEATRRSKSVKSAPPAGDRAGGEARGKTTTKRKRQTA